MILFLVLFFLSITVMSFSTAIRKEKRKIFPASVAILAAIVAIVAGFIYPPARLAMGEGAFSALIVAYSIFMLGSEEKNKKEYRMSFGIFSWIFYIVMACALARALFV